MLHSAKYFAARLPKRWQQALKRHYFAWQIRTGSFLTDEPEYRLLPSLIRSGDWVLDIGANIGHYTARFSELVGGEGRVIAFEPVCETFELLTANSARFPSQNVTLLNVAASDGFSVGTIEVPAIETGLDNFYMAHLSRAKGAGRRVLCMPVDALRFDNRVAFAKVDAEGHDFAVMKGMSTMLKRDRPIVMVEDRSQELVEYMAALGYGVHALPKSPNRIFLHEASTEQIAFVARQARAA